MNETLLNMIPNSCAPEVHLSQYDNGRVLRFVLKEGNAAYQAPSGAVVKVKATKPSGLGFIVSGTISDGNIVTVTNTATMTNEAGRFPAELSITSGSTLLGTSNFVFNIERSPHPEGTIDGDAETLLPELTLLVERIEDSNARIESMTATATTLATGEDATAEYDPETNQLVLGLPRGERGEQGEGVASLEPRVSANENAIDVLDARMDTFASLPEGSTTGDAELIDIRVAYDGTTYPTAGDSVRGQVGDLKFFDSIVSNDYYTVETNISNIDENPTWASGLLNPNGNVTNNSTYKYCSKIPVIAGDIITIGYYDPQYEVTTNNGYAERLCCYSNGTAVESAGSTSPSRPIVIPDGIDEIAITVWARYTNLVVHINRHTTDYIPKINELIASSQKSIVEKVAPTIVSGKYVNKSGTVSNSSNYYYFELDVDEGDVISGIRTLYDNANVVIGEMRFVCAYKGTTADSTLGAEYVYEYTVPADVTKVAITIESTYPLADYVDIYRTSSVNTIKSNARIESVAFGSYPQTISGNLPTSERLTINANSVKKNKAIIFKGDITSFNQITIGQGGSDLNSEKIVIDGTNITLYRGASQNGDSNAHGLTFKNYIFVMIDVDDAHIPTITIMTDGGIFRHTSASTWVGCMRTIYAETDSNTALTDCELSFVCKDIDKALWIFGDSYVSYTDDRWIYYLHQLGFDGYLLNGYSGETSGFAIKDLDNLLEYGTPKYVLWCLGANDKDGSTKANAVWKSAYDELVGTCNEKGITLILATIPNSSVLKNTFKNDIVVNSGYKYVNFAESVGALDDSAWYDGMLSSDNTHPTVEGAKALATQVFKDFPYICIK